MKKLLAAIFNIIILLSLSSCGEGDEQKVITIGSGSPKAMYYPTAVSLCEI